MGGEILGWRGSGLHWPNSAFPLLLGWERVKGLSVPEREPPSWPPCCSPDSWPATSSATTACFCPVSPGDLTKSNWSWKKTQSRLGILGWKSPWVRRHWSASVSGAVPPSPMKQSPSLPLPIPLFLPHASVPWQTALQWAGNCPHYLLAQRW